MADPDDISLPVHEFVLIHRGVSLVVCTYAVEPVGTLAVIVFRLTNRKGAPRCTRLEAIAGGAWRDGTLITSFPHKQRVESGTYLEPWPVGLPFVVQNALARELA